MDATTDKGTVIIRDGGKQIRVTPSVAREIAKALRQGADNPRMSQDVELNGTTIAFPAGQACIPIADAIDNAASKA